MNDLRDGFRLLDTVVYPKRGLIVRPQGDVHVEPGFMAVLVCLASHAGEVVGREQLVDEAWSRRAVTDDSINRAVSQLRTYLGDDRRTPRFLETIPKQGYRLLAPVEPLATIAPRAGAPEAGEPEPPSIDRDRRSWKRSLVPQLVIGTVAGTAAAVMVVLLFRAFLLAGTAVDEEIFDPPANAVAVMPFEELGFESTDNVIGNGIAEDIQAALSRIDGLFVVARSSSFAIAGSGEPVQEIGRRLGVAALLEGTVRRTGEAIRITAQLVDTRDGYQLWSSAYDRGLADVLDVQQAIAGDVAAAMAVNTMHARSLIPPPTRNFDAYNLYLQGRHFWRTRTPESLALAREYFTQAVRLDPGYALAHAGLVDVASFSVLYDGMSAGDAQAIAKPALDKALELGSALPEVHAAHGLYLTYIAPDPAGLRRAHQRARELDPNNVDEIRYQAIGYVDAGMFTEAAELYEKALRLDPLNQTVRGSYIDLVMRMGHYAQGMAMFRGASTASGIDAQLLRIAGTWAVAYGHLEHGREVLQQALERDPNGPITAGALSYLSLASGDAKTALAEADRIERIAPGNPTSLVAKSKALAALGRYGELFAFVESYRRVAVAESGGKFSWPAFWAQYYCGVTALLQQRSGDAVACLELATAMMREGGIDPEVPIEIEYRQYLVVALRGAARRDEADALLKAVRTKIDKARADGWGHPQFQLIEAAQLALEGRAEDALTQLEDTLAQGPVSGRRGSWKGAWFLGIDPAFDSLRREPRFEALLSPQAQLQDPR